MKFNEDEREGGERSGNMKKRREMKVKRGEMNEERRENINRDGEERAEER